MTENINYKAAYERQKLARSKAEDILENKSRELYEKNQSLLDAYNKLKDQKAQLLHQEKLASIGQLSAGVAHEINNPAGFVKSNINSLKRYTESIKQLIATYDESLSGLSDKNMLDAETQTRIEKVKADLDIDYVLEDIDELVSDSLSGLSRIEDIVKSLKSFARPDSDKSERFNINDCINNTIKLVWNEIKYKAELQIDLNEVPETQGYPGEISQVILNLLVNAADAIKETGTINVSTAAQDDYLILKVSDDGCGIKDEHMNTLFDPFFTTKDVDSGTGLGLSITHGIIKKHKGRIEVDSQVDQGTTFTIFLPLFETLPDGTGKYQHTEKQHDG